MIEVLLWIIVLELTAGLVVGGYVLYHMQLDLAVIALYNCVEPTVTVIDTPSLNEEPVVIDTKETIGTFAGPQAWN